MRRLVVTLELVVLMGLMVWVGAALLHDADRPPDAIDLKVQLKGAQDRVWLLQDGDGHLRYRIRLEDGTPVELSEAEFARRLYDDQRSRSWLEVLLNVSSPAGFLWVALGLLGQLLFTGRMVVQWVVSERHRRSIVPESFWWMSLIGATMLLVYFLWRREPIGLLGQATGWFIYVRNLWLIHRRGGPRTGAAEEACEPSEP